MFLFVVFLFVYIQWSSGVLLLALQSFPPYGGNMGCWESNANLSRICLGPYLQLYCTCQWRYLKVLNKIMTFWVQWKNKTLMSVIWLDHYFIYTNFSQPWAIWNLREPRMEFGGHRWQLFKWVLWQGNRERTGRRGRNREKTRLGEVYFSFQEKVEVY